MERLHQPKTEALRRLFWRDEILQLLFWIEGEGFGTSVDARDLERYLGLEPEDGRRYLAEMVAGGMLERTGTRYALTNPGRAFGRLLFIEEFADLTLPARRECGPDCWCLASPEEADACAARRTA